MFLFGYGDGIVFARAKRYFTNIRYKTNMAPTGENRSRSGAPEPHFLEVFLEPHFLEFSA